MLKVVLDYILNEARLHLFFLNLIWLGPLIGSFLGGLIGFFAKAGSRKSLFSGFLFGLGGTAVSIMWFIYNSIMNHYGLDSVKGLLVNLTVFIMAGLVTGYLIRHIRIRSIKR